MKKPKAHRAAPRSKGPAARQRAGVWSLVPVNQRPLRRKAASECNRELAKVEKARAEWRRFDREDKPAFERWVALSFGALLTTLRDTEAALRQKEMLIHEVEIEYCYVGARSYRAAYTAVMRRRTTPFRATAPELDPGDTQEDEMPGEIPEAEQEALFEDFLREFLGLDPNVLGKRKYQRMFAEFQADLFGGRPRNAAPPPPKTPPRRPEDARIKEIYRVLVRRLHPDTRADGDPEVSALWHEVQEAYDAGSFERLETLLALTDIRSKSAGEQTSLFQMRDVLAELRRAFQALRKSLRAARKDPAWNFSRNADRNAVQARLQRKFEADLAARQKRLRECEALVARWSRPLKSRRGWVSELQVEFSF